MTLTLPASEVLPVIDLARASPTAIAEGLVEYSCVFITNHGLSAELREAMFAVSREFLTLDAVDKEPYRWHGQGIWCGWQAVAQGTKDIVGERPAEPLERFEMYEPDTFPLWPRRPASLRPIWEEFHAHSTTIVSRLMELLIDGLDLPPEFRDAWTDEQFSSLCANYYHPQPTPPPVGQLRTEPHTDHGGLTLLSADDAPGGLEVKLPRIPGWLPVIIPPQMMLVQAGDLLSRWTNRRVRGNLHRVVNPPPEQAMTSRVSVVFFHHPNLDTLVEPAPSQVALSRSPALAPLLAREHCLNRQVSYGKVDEERRGELDPLDGRSDI
jgi:isopenicillin N synthase-like dioxygenase